MLRAARALGRERDVDVVTTFLGAHALPPEVDGDKDALHRPGLRRCIPPLARERLADAVDALLRGHRVLARADRARVRRRARRTACR